MTATTGYEETVSSKLESARLMASGMKTNSSDVRIVALKEAQAALIMAHELQSIGRKEHRTSGSDVVNTYYVAVLQLMIDDLIADSSRDTSLQQRRRSDD